MQATTAVAKRIPSTNEYITFAEIKLKNSTLPFFDFLHFIFDTTGTHFVRGVSTKLALQARKTSKFTVAMSRPRVTVRVRHPILGKIT